MMTNSSEKASATPPALKEFALTLKETALVPANSFKTQVYIGEKFIFRLPESDKEKYVLTILNEQLDPLSQHIIPKIITTTTLEELGEVHVYTKLLGTHPTAMTDSLASDLGKFLLHLHAVKNWDKVTEFEGGEEMDFAEYLKTSSTKYLKKLPVTLSSEDTALATRARDAVQEYAEHISTSPKLVLVHKDLHLDNLLTDDDSKLTGVIDWGASQTAPREWEFAILRQRIPEHWEKILESYGKENIDFKLMDICGLIQSLRFWKSFPQDIPFAEEQKDYIKKILNHTSV